MIFIVDLLLYRKKFPPKRRPAVAKSLAEVRHLACAKYEDTYLMFLSPLALVWWQQ